MDDDKLRRLKTEGKFFRASQLARSERSSEQLRNKLLWALWLPLTLVIAAAIIYGLAAGASKIAELASRQTGGLILSVIANPVLLTAVGVVILAFGLPRAPRFPRPSRFRNGTIAVAAALMTFWPLQYLATRIAAAAPDFQLVFHGLGAFVSVCLLTGGMESMRMAKNTPRDDSWEFLNN